METTFAMSATITGIHHVTALAKDPQKNLDFYTGVMGLRLVKLTVNFDAPEVYHLYYGDATGRPGTILTFFPFPDAAKGRSGIGQATAVAFLIPVGSLEYWIDRLASRAIHFDGPSRRFEDQFISFEDPDGLLIELVATPDAEPSQARNRSQVPPEHALRRFYGVTLYEDGFEATARVLSETLGFRHVSSSGNRYRFVAGTGINNAYVDILCSPGSEYGRMSAGSIHHVAWRTPDRQHQDEWRNRIAESGLNVTPVVDRAYFTSIYFHEPGGILFEVATDPPGFTVDEPLEKLGTSLKLPAWLESERNRLEQVLPPVRLPGP